MGAYGCALIAKNSFNSAEIKPETTLLSINSVANIKSDIRKVRCGKCTNNCLLTINKFSDGKIFVSGNRCEKGDLSNKNSDNKDLREKLNLFSYKYKRLFDYYKPLDADKAYMGEIGIPRALNIYENYPFWATFFKNLGFRVVLSPKSNRKIYELGMETIPSESECYPAKLSHGHIQWLINEGVTRIFHPCVFYERQETPGAQNHYNCPIVVSYSENLKNNVEEVVDGKVEYIRPFIAFTNEKTAADFALAVSDELCFGSNMRSSDEYRRMIAPVLIRRAILSAAGKED